MGCILQDKLRMRETAGCSTRLLRTFICGFGCFLGMLIAIRPLPAGENGTTAAAPGSPTKVVDEDFQKTWQACRAATTALRAVPPVPTVKNLVERRAKLLRDRLPVGIPALWCERTRRDLAQLEQAADAVRLLPPGEYSQHLESIAVLAAAKRRVDFLFTQVQTWRRFVAVGSTDEVNDAAPAAVQSFLAVTRNLLETSARLNSHLRILCVSATARAAVDNELRTQLLQRVREDKSTIGVSVLVPVLFDPPVVSGSRLVPATPRIKREILRLLGQHGRREAVPALWAVYPSLPDAECRLQCLDTIVRLGCDQVSPAPAANREVADEDTTQKTRPQSLPTLANILRELNSLPEVALSADWQRHRTMLQQWIRARLGAQGQTAESHSLEYQANGLGLKPGDWLLYCNSSPYTRFTTLTPGLFTHVGILAEDRRRPGQRALVVVDLNERQTHIPGEAVETNLPLPRYFAVLRHQDATVAAQMAQAAAKLLGNSVEFDLTFNTARVRQLAGKDLSQQKLTTYCVGVLIACAQQTDRSFREFFPIAEAVSSKTTAKNLQRMGLSVGADFVSPTGAYFSPEMTLIHFSEPMYDPGDEVQQQIYDHFAKRLADRTLSPRLSWFQSLRTQLADVAGQQPFLAEALARAAGVDATTDLAAGARALAVVETLDYVALSEVSRFRRNWRELLAPAKPKAATQAAADTVSAKLTAAWRSGQIDILDLERRLIQTCVRHGQERLDRVFFTQSSP